ITRLGEGDGALNTGGGKVGKSLGTEHSPPFSLRQCEGHGAVAGHLSTDLRAPECLATTLVDPLLYRLTAAAEHRGTVTEPGMPLGVFGFVASAQKSATRTTGG